MATESAIETIKRLDQERAKLIDTAKTDALTRAQQAIEDLKALGFEYDMVEGGMVGAKTPKGTKVAGRIGAKKNGSGKGKASADKPCTVCGFQTEPPHDARKHRFTQKKKKPFTPAELKAHGLTKV
jgi:hypothetical protein